jgi:non-ribosomal peptide synthetase component E (peptide arylation enzyme)
VQLPNWHEFVYSFLAVRRYAIVVLCIPRHSQMEIIHSQADGSVAWILPKQYGKIAYQPIIDDVLRESPDQDHPTGEAWRHTIP